MALYKQIIVLATYHKKILQTPVHCQFYFTDE